MKLSTAKKLVAAVLSALMLIGASIPAFAADKTTDSETESRGSTLVEISEALSTLDYYGYTQLRPLEENRAAPTDKIDIDVTGDYIVGAVDDVFVNEDGVMRLATEEDKAAAATDATSKTDATATTDATSKTDATEGVRAEKEPEILKNYVGDKGESLYVPDTTTVTWTFDVKKTGYYCITFDYCAIQSENSNGDKIDMVTNIERVMYVNGKVPFTEARHIELNKKWTYNYQSDERDTCFKSDANGNETRPTTKVEYEWQTVTLADSKGYYLTPLEFYFEEGENSISLEGVRDIFAVRSITLAGYEALPSYSDVKAEYEAKGYTAADAETIKIQAEMPSAVSDYTIYPINDLTSAITEPQSATKTKQNAVGGDKWTGCGQWVEYEIDVPASGLYTITPRFRQWSLRGIAVSRTVYIDGEIPFAEAQKAQFKYSNDWQMKPLNDGYQDFEFYLEAGAHTIRLEVSLGEMTQVVNLVNQITTSLNNDYLEFMKLTGVEPDANRTYGFSRIMPETVNDLAIQGDYIREVLDLLSEINGIRSDNISSLEQTALLLDKISEDENEIAANLDELKQYISSLGTWISDVSLQSVDIDYLLIQGADKTLPKYKDNFWQSIGYEFQKFFGSFFNDYDSISGADGETTYSETITAWTTSGRDQAKITKNLIENNFTANTGINVDLKLIAAGTLNTAIIAGTAPDVSLDSTTPLDLAIREAILPFNDFDTFDDVMTRFADSAWTAVTIYDKVYAIPVSQGFPVMFYRKDILADLGLEIPKTWDEMLAMEPVLQFNNMDVGLLNDFTIFLYQMGGAYWRNDGMATNFDDKTTLDAFETMCNYYTQNSLPFAYDFATRFKNGEVPISIQLYTSYNNLVIYAPEITGLWDFEALPGTVREDGSIDNTTISTISGVVMLRTCKDQEAAWRLIDWYTDKEMQVDYSNEMAALLGPSAKIGVANKEALKELPWSDKEYKTLETAINNSVVTPPYPGDYMAGRYLGFAFTAAYSEGKDPSDSLLSYVDALNKELTRKRKEFGLMITPEWNAVQEYMGFEDYDEWKAYAEENGINTGLEAEGRKLGLKLYPDWMKENGITVDNYADWQNETENGNTTLSYKDWLAE